MSSTKRPCARACAQEEVVTNWKIVRIVLGLGILAGACLALNWWSSHRAAKQRAIAAKAPDTEPQPTAHGKSRELRREVFVYNRRIPNSSELPEQPPRWTPGPLEAPEPTHFRLGADSALDGVNLYEMYADAVMGYAPLVAPPVVRPTFDEDDLLGELGFPKEKSTANEEAPSMSLSQTPWRHPDAPARPEMKVVTLDLDDSKGAAKKLRDTVAKAFSTQRSSTKPAGESDQESSRWEASDAPADAWLGLVAQRTDFRGLPFRRGAECKLEGPAASILGATSQGLGGLVGPLGFRGTVLVDRIQRELSIAIRRSPRLETPSNIEPDQLVPGLVQILQASNSSSRQVLIEALATIDGRNATTALAQRALFDLSADLRRTAIAALAKRSAKEYRHQLLAALRYPWPAIADHAAATLISVGDEGAVPELVEMLDKPDPAAPFINERGKWAMRELARVNHLRNCLLCHAPSLSRTDVVRGVIPVPGEPLPLRQYYHSSQGIFVRADITYLKQDFSLTHPVKDHGYWPEQQRFDYFVRTRELTKEEIVKRSLPREEIGRQRPLGGQEYPQREAVLYALRELTGQDFGRVSEDWRVLVRK